MHPWITSDKPGRCTICGMPLVLVSQDGASASDAAATNAGGGGAAITLTAAQHSVSQIQSAAVTRGTLTRSLRANGTLHDDETRHRILAARVPGRVETLHVNYIGAEVRAGEVLATLYSPELLSAQRSYLEHLQAGEAFAATARAAARERLLELGLTELEVHELERTQRPSATHTLRAPMSGTIVARSAYEGQYVSASDSLFELCDLSQLWFIFDLYEPDLAWIRVGQEVEISLPSLPGETLRAPIAFIDPNLDPVTRTARARVVLDNPERALLRRQTGTVSVHVSSPDTLLVPRSAVLRHSGSALVFVEQGERHYAAREVTLGRIGDTHAEVRAGLSEGEQVVVEGGLILDGQAQLAQINRRDTAHTQHAPPATATPVDARAPENPGHTQHAAHAPHDTHAAQETHSGHEATRALLAAALVAADAAQALASDDYAAYQKQLPALRAAAETYLATAGGGQAPGLAALVAALAPGADIRAARAHFEPFSTALADLARAAQLHHRGESELHIFQCPMTPVLGTGRWLARSSELRNPFFGEMMLECGEELH